VIRKPIVIVTGAGASAVFDFPVGVKLREQVINWLITNGPAHRFFSGNTRFTPAQMENFREQLRLSAQPSVDLFLEHRSEFTDVGKAAMAYVLAQSEVSTSLWDKPEVNWLTYLFGQMRAPFETFHQNAVSFVTFNYDRSIEHFLVNALGASYGKPPEQCAAVLQRIPIIHLHGRLGFLPWQSPDGRPYAPITDAAGLQLCVREMKIIHEDIADRDNDFQHAKRLLRDAWRIYFLGFGYGTINVSRLGILDLPNNKARGTGVDIANAEHQQINNLTQGKITVQQYVDCISLFRDWAEWD
jgi:hypothetical protein